MKAHTSPKNRLGWFTVMVLAVQGLNSCSLPPREAWQRIKDEGVLHALFAPHRATRIDADRVASSSTTSGPQAGGGLIGPPAPIATPRIPTAEVFPGHRGFVYSPFTHPKKLVNTSGFAPGEHALCPYTLELFIVPDYGQASAVASRLDSSKMGSEKKSDTGPSNPAVVELVSRDLASPLPPSFPASPPYGAWVAGRPGYVYSPFAAKHQLVDVTGIAPGVEVKCPYTGKLFRVPEHSEVTVPATVPPMPEAADPSAEKPATTPEPTVPSPAADSGTAPTPPPSAESALPTAAWVDGKPGLVQSPFGKPGQLVDVTGKEAGAKVICPFSNKPFLVPAK